MPVITTPRVLNKKTGGIPIGAIYCGRPSPFGNPFVIGRNGNRAEVIARYEAWLTTQPQLIERLPELTGHDLVCWCAPLACHCDVLIRLTIAGLVRDMARQHVITFVPGPADAFALAVSRLSDAEADVDETLNLLTALGRAGILSGHDTIMLHAAHLGQTRQ